mgnify:CR=1 FL=1
MDGKVIEIFGENNKDVVRTMKISRSEFTIIEENKELKKTVRKLKGREHLKGELAHDKITAFELWREILMYV